MKQTVPHTMQAMAIDHFGGLETLTFPLQQVADAHRMLETHFLGKLTLKIE